MDMTRTNRWRIRAIFLIAITVFPLLPVAAQIESNAINTRSYRWKSIETAHYRVIFPEALEEKGRYVASALEALRPLQETTMKPRRVHRFSVIINPDQIRANGYVSVLPRRSVFYTVPDSSMPGDWLTLLATHEGRHMFQFDELNQGVVRAASYLVGEYAAALVISVPGWWIEGDSVMAETVLSETGRGRTPRFTAQTKALLLDDTAYGYNKMILGSYRAYTPSMYEFGYLMYSYIRSEYDEKAPETLLKSEAWCPVPALGPHLATKKATGKSAPAVYREMAARYGKFWKDQVASLDVTASTPLAAQGKSPYRAHTAIAPRADGAVIAAAFDIEGNADIVSIRDGKEKRLCRGYPLNSLDSGGSFAVWDELENEAKFDQGNTTIALFDLDRGRKRALFRNSKYISPALSRDGTTLALVEFSDTSPCSLVIASTEDASIIKRYPIPEGEIWSDLSFSPSGTEIAFVSNGVGGKAGRQGKYLGKISLSDGATAVVYDARWENVMTPAIVDDAILYVSNYSGIDSVWAIDSAGKRYQVVSRPIGAYMPKPDPSGTSLVFVDYANSRGTVVARADVPRASWVPLDRVKVVREDFYADAAKADPGTGKGLPENFPLTDAKAEPFSPLLDGNKIDGWYLVPAMNGDTAVTGYVQADNVTGISSQKLFLTYDYTDSEYAGFYQYRYRGFAPDLVFTGGSAMRDRDGASKVEPAGSVAVEFPLAGGVAGSALWNAVLGVSGGGAVKNEESEATVAGYGNATARSGRWSLSLVGSWSFVATEGPGDNHPYGLATLSVPGVFSRDALTVQGSYERRHDWDDNLTMAYARGYYGSDALEAWKSSAEYSLPLLYPDFPVGALLYFDLIRLNAFYDARKALDIDEDQLSAGAELLFHFMPLQIPFEIQAGVRYSHRIEENDDAFDIVVMGIPVASY
jgi:hypothetical protein